MSKKQEKQVSGVGRRMAIVAFVITLIFLRVLLKVYHLQTVDNEDLKRRSDAQSSRVVKIKAKRGSIFDRNHKELAVSGEAPSIAVRPALISDPDALSAKLASILNKSKAAIYEKLTSKRGFIWLSRRTTPEVADAVRQLKEKGLEVHMESRRYYPRKTIAGQLIGFTDIDGVGREGLERAYDKRLTGKEFKISAIRDAHGRTLLNDSLPEFTKFEGESLVLTIDERIQSVAEEALEKTVKDYDAKGGYAIVIDVKTGDILALANTPKFNPNFFFEYPPNAWRLRNITDTFEPGSVIKPLVLAAALQEKTIRLDSRFDCEGGRIRIGKYNIRDSHRYDLLTAAEIIQHSSNIGSYKIAQTFGRQKLYDYLRAFGFGTRTGLGLPGEQPGLLWSPDKWAEVSFANIAFGQGFTATPIQVAAALAAIGNGGMLMKPQIVKKILDKDGNVIRENTPTLVRRVVSPEVAKQVAWALSLVTREGGTGTKAALDDYNVAGKTGTAQKVNPKTRRYDPNMWTANFVGFVPAEKPDVAIAVVIDEPQENHFGGVVAAPVFKKIAEEVLTLHGVVPVPKKDRFKFYDPQELRRESQEKMVAEQLKQEAPELKLEEVQLPPIKVPPPVENAMPDLMGNSLRQALERSEKAGFLPSVTGWGVVVDQQPKPGESLDDAKEIYITLAPDEAHASEFKKERDAAEKAEREGEVPHAEGAE